MTLKVPDNQTIVIFGATGDLTGRKLMPALYNLFVESLLPEDFAVIGYSRTEMSTDEFREHQAANVAKYSRTGLDPEATRRAINAVLETLAERVPGDQVDQLIGQLPIELCAAEIAANVHTRRDARQQRSKKQSIVAAAVERERGQACALFDQLDDCVDFGIGEWRNE